MSLADQFERLNNIKLLIREALAGKGVNNTADMNYDDFADAIDSIEQKADVSNTTATADDVRANKYFYDANGVYTEGTLLDRTSVDTELPESGSIIIPKGIYTQQSTVYVPKNHDTFQITQRGVLDMGEANLFAHFMFQKSNIVWSTSSPTMINQSEIANMTLSSNTSNRMILAIIGNGMTMTCTGTVLYRKQLSDTITIGDGSIPNGAIVVIQVPARAKCSLSGMNGIIGIVRKYT